MVQVSQPAPVFKGTAVMPNGSFAEISLDQYLGKYVLLWFYPLGFSFVCPSELVAFDQAMDEFTQRNVEVIACSVDSHFVSARWRNTPLKQGGIGPVKYPILSDLNHNISKDYGCYVNPPGFAVRALYLIDKTGVIRHITINDPALGRSVDEALRVIDALQHHEVYGEVCPANWKRGQPAMKPSEDGVATYMTSMG